MRTGAAGVSGAAGVESWPAVRLGAHPAACGHVPSLCTNPSPYASSTQQRWALTGQGGDGRRVGRDDLRLGRAGQQLGGHLLHMSKEQAGACMSQGTGLILTAAAQPLSRNSAKAAPAAAPAAPVSMHCRSHMPCCSTPLLAGRPPHLAVLQRLGVRDGCTNGQPHRHAVRQQHNGRQVLLCARGMQHKHADLPLLFAVIAG